MLRDRKTILLLGDILVLITACATMIALRFEWITDQVIILTQIELFGWLFLLWLIIFFIFDLYNLRRVNPNPRTIGLLALAITTSIVISILALYLFPYSGTPKTNLAIVAIVSFFLLVLWRRLFYTLFASKFAQRIAVIGTGPAIEHLLSDLATHRHLGKVVSIQPTFTSTDALPDITLIISDGVDPRKLLTIAHEKRCDVLSLSEAYSELFGKVPVTLMTDEKALEILSTRKQASYRFIERAIEIITASLILLIASPFLLIAALAILIEDGGPVLYRQSRVGYNHIPFSIFKLRTMRKNAEAAGAQWAQQRDPRVTRVGALLRKTHLDEVPQMLNIIRGELALIGPRPERPEFVTTLEQQIPYYFLRHRIKPGFTGWAQIKFRYARTALDSREKFEYDLYYLLHKNPLLDLGILAKTIQIIFTH